MFLRILFLVLLSKVCLANSFYLDKNEIKIGLRFKGDAINLYGIQKTPGKVIIILKGQKATYFIQKKEKKLGIWIKGEKKHFENVHRYYSIFSDTYLDKMNIPHLLKPFEIGIENINTYFNSVENTLENFEHKNALFRHKIENNLFVEKYGYRISTPENLIYTNLKIPSNIPEGNYMVSVYIVSEGKIQSINNLPVYIHQVGILKFVKHAAKEQKMLYLLLGIVSSVGIAALGYFILGGKFMIPFRFIKNTTYKLAEKFGHNHKPKEIHKNKRGRPRKIRE